MSGSRRAAPELKQADLKNVLLINGQGAQRPSSRRTETAQNLEGSVSSVRGHLLTGPARKFNGPRAATPSIVKVHQGVLEIKTTSAANGKGKSKSDGQKKQQPTR